MWCKGAQLRPGPGNGHQLKAQEILAQGCLAGWGNGNRTYSHAFTAVSPRGTWKAWGTLEGEEEVSDWHRIRTVLGQALRVLVRWVKYWAGGCGEDFATCRVATSLQPRHPLGERKKCRPPRKRTRPTHQGPPFISSPGHLYELAA